MKDPTLVQLRTFLAVADEAHFGRAADRLHTTQPPVSRAITALERNLGVRLFNRTTRSVELTNSGRHYLAATREALGVLDRARTAIDLTPDDPTPPLALGHIEAVAHDYLPNTLAALTIEVPKVDVLLQELHVDEQIKALERGDLDLAIVRAPVALPWLQSCILYRDELVLAVPSMDSDLAQRDRISLNEIKDRPFACYAPTVGTGLLSSTVQACGRLGFAPRFVREATSTPQLLSLVASGRFVAVVSSALAFTPRVGVKFLSIEESVSSDILLAWSSKNSHPELAVVREVLERQRATVSGAAGTTPLSG